MTPERQIALVQEARAARLHEHGRPIARSGAEGRKVARGHPVAHTGSEQHIIRRKAAEDALRRSEERFRLPV